MLSDPHLQRGVLVQLSYKVAMARMAIATFELKAPQLTG